MAGPTVTTARRTGMLLAILAAAVIGVLSHGAMQRVAPTGGESSAGEVSAPKLPPMRPDLEKTPLAYLSDYWRQLGDRARSRIVMLGSPRTPALVVAPGLAVASFQYTRPGGDPARHDACAVPTRLLASEPDLGLSLLEVSPPASLQPFEAAAPSSLHPGLLIAAVTLAPDDRLKVAPGHLVSTPSAAATSVGADSLEVSLAFPPSTRAAAIVDLDGRLVGAAFASEGGLRLVSAEALLRLVERLQSDPVCRSIDVAPLDDPARRLLRVRGGVVVARVRHASFVPQPSLREGDVLLEWSGHSVSSPEQFRQLYEKQARGALVAYSVLRAGRLVRGGMVMPGPDCRPVEEPLVLSKLGVTLQPGAGTAPGWEVAAITADGPAERADLRVGDRILDVRGPEAERQGPLDAVRRFERRPRPLLLTVRRDGRTRLLAISPDAE